MEIDKDYMRFKRWFKKAERGFYCSQFSDEQIARAAWIEAQKPLPAKMFYVQNTGTISSTTDESAG